MSILWRTLVAGCVLFSLPFCRGYRGGGGSRSGGGGGGGGGGCGRGPPGSFVLCQQADEYDESLADRMVNLQAVLDKF